MIEVILSEQDLSDFLEDNQEWMEAYEAELQKRLAEHFEVSVSVEVSSNALVDKFNLPDDVDRAEVDHIMSLMTNDWSWLPQ